MRQAACVLFTPLSTVYCYDNSVSGYSFIVKELPGIPAA